MKLGVVKNWIFQFLGHSRFQIKVNDLLYEGQTLKSTNTVTESISSKSATKWSSNFLGLTGFGLRPAICFSYNLSSFTVFPIIYTKNTLLYRLITLFRHLMTYLTQVRGFKVDRSSWENTRVFRDFKMLIPHVLSLFVVDDVRKSLLINRCENSRRQQQKRLHGCLCFDSASKSTDDNMRSLYLYMYALLVRIWWCLIRKWRCFSQIMYSNWVRRSYIKTRTSVPSAHPFPHSLLHSYLPFRAVCFTS